MLPGIRVSRESMLSSRTAIVAELELLEPPEESDPVEPVPSPLLTLLPELSLEDDAVEVAVDAESDDEGGKT